MGVAGEFLLVFDAAGRLASWSPAAAEPAAGVADLLAVGAPSGGFDAALAGWAVSDLPLVDGGFVRRCEPAAARPAEAAGRLFAAASHDLRQPLAALSLLMGVLDDRGDPRQRDLMRSMGAAVRSLKAKVDGHLDLARLGAGLLETEVADHAVNGILMRLALDFGPRFEDRNLRFSVLPCSAMVRTDAVLLERILNALLANALHHTERGRVVLGCRIRRSELRIEVWDTAGGLGPPRLDTLRRALAAPDGEDSPALGLGLRLARGLARRLGHRLEVASRPGRGSVFAVVVPRMTEAAAATPAALPDMEGVDVSRARVLVIEDDRLVLDALAVLLEQWGCTVTAAPSYDSALAALGPDPVPPDLVVADLRLHGAANGIVAIRQLAKALDTPLPGLILTGDTDPKRLREARLSGYPVLHKPVPPLALRTAVARLLGGRRLGA